MTSGTRRSESKGFQVQTPPRTLFDLGMSQRVGKLARDLRCQQALVATSPVLTSEEDIIELYKRACEPLHIENTRETFAHVIFLAALDRSRKPC